MGSCGQTTTIRCEMVFCVQLTFKTTLLPLSLSLSLKHGHQKCAISWFIPLAQGKAEGLALDRNWSLRWFCRCEICGHNLDERFVEELVLSCQDRLKRGETNCEDAVRCGA